MRKILLLLGVIALIIFVVIGWQHMRSRAIMSAANSDGMLATLCDLIHSGCGGKLVTPPIPCFGSGAVWAKILVAGVDAGGPVTSYIFWPTIYLHYLPTHVGQSFVGLTTGRGFCATDPTNFHKGFTAPSSWFYGTSI